MPMIEDGLAELNRIIRSGNAVYSEMARSFGMSESLFWILYTLRESGEALTQSQVVSDIQFPKQTINSALRGMLKDGLITLEEGRRAKPIRLTERGEALCVRTVDRVLAQEKAAFDALSETEQTEFLTLFARWTDHFSARLHALFSEENTPEKG